MKKGIIFLIFSILFFNIQAQNDKKTRNTADNSKQAVSARKISSRFNSGLKSFYTSQFEDAERQFSRILSEQPKHAPSYYMLAKIYSERGQFPEAENALKQATKIEKENIWYKTALADVYLKSENYKKAVPLWENICHEMPQNEIYLFNLYECYQKLNNTDKMIETLNQIESVLGVNEDVTRNKVILWLRKNDIKSALGEYDRLIELYPWEISNYMKAGLTCENLKRYDDALKYYEKAYKNFPENAEIAMMLANFWILQNNEEKSLPYIESVIPNSDVDIKVKLPFIKKQIENLSPATQEKAENFVNQLVTAHPNASESYAAKGEVCYKMNNYSCATDNFEKALTLDDSDIELWQKFINSAKNCNKYDKISRFEEEISTLFPQQSDILCTLAEAFFQQHKFEKAKEYFKQARVFSFDAQQKAAIDKRLKEISE